jgi:hypothetical protein
MRTIPSVTERSRRAQFSAMPRKILGINEFFPYKAVLSGVADSQSE